MATVIKPKRSETASAIPTAGSLEVGELALNVTDGKFYTKTSANAVKEVGGAGSVTLQNVMTNGASTITDLLLDQGANLIFEGNLSNAYETTLTVAEPTADRTVALPEKTGTIQLLDGLILNSTDGSANAGDNIVQNTSANDGDRILLEDATSDPILVLASHGITLSGVGWNTFQFDNDHS